MNDEVCSLIIDERMRQDKMHPKFEENLAMAVMAEEFGEIGTAVQNKDDDNLEEELIQIAAFAIRWYEYLRSERG